MVTNKQPGEPRASLLVEHWAKQSFATILTFTLWPLHCDPWIKSDGDSIHNSCDVFEHFGLDWDLFTNIVHVRFLQQLGCHLCLSCFKYFQVDLLNLYIRLNNEHAVLSFDKIRLWKNLHFERPNHFGRHQRAWRWTSHHAEKNVQRTCHVIFTQKAFIFIIGRGT